MGDKKELPNLNAIYLGSIALQGFRAFPDDSIIDFRDSEGHPAQWTVILGENGTAKTGLLQAIASVAPFYDRTLARQFEATSEKDENQKALPGWIPKSMQGPSWFQWWASNRPRNRENVPSETRFTVEFCTSTGGIESASTGSNTQFENIPPRWSAGVDFGESEDGHAVASLNFTSIGGSELSVCHMLAFGASRLIQPREQRSTPKRSIDSIYDSYDLVDSPENWLIQLDHARRLEADAREKAKADLAYNSAKRCICDVLPDIEDVRIVKTKVTATTDAEVRALFKCPYGWVLFEELGQGYQSMASWAIDLLRHLHHYYGHLNRPETGAAIVLIDEFDLHLHPKWQLNLMGHLGKIFENCQFIVTAHSPLMVQAAGPTANLVVLRHEHQEGTSWIMPDSDPVRIRGWRLDQIITSDLFGLSSARPPKYAELFSRRAELVRMRSRTREQDEELKEVTLKLEREAPPSISKDAADLLAELKTED